MLLEGVRTNILSRELSKEFREAFSSSLARTEIAYSPGLSDEVFQFQAGEADQPLAS